MKHRKLSIFAVATVLICLSAPVRAAHPSTRNVVCDTICNAHVDVLLGVVNDFYRQFQSYSDSLYMWAYEGLQETEQEQKATKTKESRNAIQLKYKDKMYDPDHKIGDVAMDIYVLGMPWWKDQHLGTRYEQYPLFDTEYYPLVVRLDASYSGTIIRGGHFIIHLEPLSETQTRMYYEFSITFGKMLTAFVSDKTWQKAIEWRFVTICSNLVQTAELGSVQAMIDQVIAMRSLKN